MYRYWQVSREERVDSRTKYVTPERCYKHDNYRKVTWPGDMGPANGEGATSS